MIDILPPVTPLESPKNSDNRMLITAEGFEKRSLSFLSLDSLSRFSKIIICKYSPPKKSKHKELYDLACMKCDRDEIYEENFNRYDPFDFENALAAKLKSVNSFDEVLIDVSVMSKYMIMQIVCLLHNYHGMVRVIYTEPKSYAPSKVKYERSKALQSSSLGLPTSGVGGIIRTPLLSSIIMQRSPTMLIAFLSFNEQLIRALLSETTPSRLLLINGVPPHLAWREKATSDLHSSIIADYSYDNKLSNDALLLRKSSTLNYTETFSILADVYKKHCTDYRIVISPTGSKMQALACALLKLCCEDIHVEYPVPESYFIAEYSSSEIREIHQIVFEHFSECVNLLRETYKLNE